MSFLTFPCRIDATLDAARLAKVLDRRQREKRIRAAIVTMFLALMLPLSTAARAATTAASTGSTAPHEAIFAHSAPSDRNAIAVLLERKSVVLISNRFR